MPASVRPSVFAVEDTAAQLVWPAGRDGHSAPEALDVSGLPPGSETVAEGVAVRTLATPPGRELFRFATVNDLHVGDRDFSFLGHMVKPLARVGPSNFALNCATAALREAVAWGAGLVVVKGDMTRVGEPAEFDEIGRLLAAQPVPVEIVLGNHDVMDVAVDPRAELARHGFVIPHRPWSRDVPGLRLVFVNTPIPGNVKHGQVPAEDRAAISDLLADARPGAGFVAMHHQLRPHRWPSVYPPGLVRHDSAALLHTIQQANRNTVVVSGHTHRHRRHQFGSVVAAEVGSTKDYPGTWAGYVVHEGGILQVVRRVAEPACLAWTESTRNAVGGIWGRWSPGLRSHRCFVHPWLMDR